MMRGHEPAHTGVRREVPFEEDAAEAGVLGANAQVAAKGHAHARAGAHAVHGGDGGLVEVVDGHRLAADPAPLVEPFVLGDGALFASGRRAGDVGAGAEAAAGARDDDGPDAVIGAGFGEDREEVLLEAAAEGVEPLGAVEGDHGDVVLPVVEKVFVGHAGSFARWFAAGRRCAPGGAVHPLAAVSRLAAAVPYPAAARCQRAAPARRRPSEIPERPAPPPQWCWRKYPIASAITRQSTSL